MKGTCEVMNVGIRSRRRALLLKLDVTMLIELGRHAQKQRASASILTNSERSAGMVPPTLQLYPSGMQLQHRCWREGGRWHRCTVRAAAWAATARGGVGAAVRAARRRGSAGVIQQVQVPKPARPWRSKAVSSEGRPHTDTLPTLRASQLRATIGRSRTEGKSG